MALLWVESFDNFGTSGAPSPTGVIARKYPLTGEETHLGIVTGRLDGGYAIQPVWDSTCYFSPGNLTTNATLIVGFALKFATLPNDNSVFLYLYDGSTAGVNLAMRSSGELSVYRGATLLGTTTGAGIGAGSWVYIELKVVCGSSGSYQVKVGGVSKLSDSGNTKAGSNDYHTTFRFRGVSTVSSKSPIIDDLYCLDASGSVNNTFLGNMKVTTARPEANSGSPQWTAHSAANYANVAESVANDDTDYNEDSTSTHKDLYDYTAVPGITGSIAGVQVNTDCRETDATPFSLITVCKSNTTETDDGGQAIGTTSYVTKKRILEQNPHTTSAWSETTLDAAQFGVKVA